jgi:DNA-binding IclR family transcriptional regulator
MLSVHRTVVYGFVSTLADHRLVARYPDGRYRIGMGAGPRGRVETNLQRAAFPWLSTLAEDLGATAFLVVADGEEAVAVLTVEPSRSSFHIAYRPGFRHPLDRGASGIAILAAAPVGAA